MLMDGRSFETIRRPSSALVQHADSACRLGLARLDWDISIFGTTQQKIATNRRHRRLDAKTVQEQADVQAEKAEEGKVK